MGLSVFRKHRLRSDLSLVSSDGQGGQIVVEYVLLLVVGVAVAFLISSTMVSRNLDQPGFLIAKWKRIIDVVGQDQSDDVQR